MTTTVSGFKELLDRSPWYELTYRTALWIAIGSIISNQIIYSQRGDAFAGALNRYIAGIGSWDKIAVLSLLATSVLYALRSLEFSVLTDKSKIQRWLKYAIGILAKISGDIALGAFGAGVAIVATIARVPGHTNGTSAEYLALFGAIGLLGLIVLVLGGCYLVSKLGPNTWLYGWQEEHWALPRLLTPIAVILFVCYYAFAL